MRRLAVAMSVAVLAAPAAFAQDHIEVTHAEGVTSMVAPDAAYTGTAVATMMALPNDNSDLAVADIAFAPGARTAWHNHPAGQYLMITSGVGWVQERGGEKIEVRAGDVVWTPPGVFHWHGATATTGMGHLAVWNFVDGSGGELAEHVTDEEYLAEPSGD